MNLLEALQCLSDHLPYGVSIETWVGVPAKDGKPRVIVRRLSSHGDENEYFCSTDEEWFAAIQAAAVLHALPRSISEFDDLRNEGTIQSYSGTTKQGEF